MADSDDPFFQPDLTQRPRPGGRSGGAPPGGFGSGGPPPTLLPDLETPRAQLGVGLNPLVRAASPLLLLAGKLRGNLTQLDVAWLRRYALDEIRRFEEQARGSGVQHEIVLAARYALCASLDEAVLSTPFGAQSEWAQHPILVALHREAWGGEKFFEMLERISVDPPRYIDLMELQYLCLALGFTGKYRDRGSERLVELQQNLYRAIREQRGVPEEQLSLRWKGLEDRRNRLIRYVPWWVVGAAALAALTVAFVVYYSRLATVAAPIETRLAQVGIEDFSAPPPPRVPAPGQTLKQLLARDEAAGAMTVEEDGAQTVVTLIGTDLFKSGSAVVNPEYGAALQRIAAAINKVPGRVLVMGHTDDQPIQSLQFRNNVELSRERALSVTKILQQSMDTPARVRWDGAGASQPRFRPEADPANRARNRRVEIIHVRGA